MLPSGHIAGGYLVTHLLLKTLDLPFTYSQTLWLYGLGIFFSFAPDLDTFYSFFKLRQFTLNGEIKTHRQYISHAPLLWLIIGFSASAIGALLGEPFVIIAGLLVWLGSWTHFLLDSIQHGIMWFWPFSNRVFSLKDRGREITCQSKNFFAFWFEFVRRYFTEFKLSSFSEIIIILVAILVFFS